MKNIKSLLQHSWVVSALSIKSKIWSQFSPIIHL